MVEGVMPGKVEALLPDLAALWTDVGRLALGELKVGDVPFKHVDEGLVHMFLCIRFLLEIQASMSLVDGALQLRLSSEPLA